MFTLYNTKIERSFLNQQVIMLLPLYNNLTGLQAFLFFAGFINSFLYSAIRMNPVPHFLPHFACHTNVTWTGHTTSRPQIPQLKQISMLYQKHPTLTIQLFPEMLQSLQKIRTLSPPASECRWDGGLLKNPSLFVSTYSKHGLPSAKISQHCCCAHITYGQKTFVNKQTRSQQSLKKHPHMSHTSLDLMASMLSWKFWWISTKPKNLSPERQSNSNLQEPHTLLFIVYQQAPMSISSLLKTISCCP